MERDRSCSRLRRILRPYQIGIERRSRLLLALQHEAQRSQASAQLLGGHFGQVNACQGPGGLYGARANRAQELCAHLPFFERHGSCLLRRARTRRSLLLALAPAPPRARAFTPARARAFTLAL